MEKLSSTIFYKIEKAIKSYRQFAQRQLKEAGLKITIDQWLIINCILDDPEISQQEIAEKVFKDNASVTRIIDLLVKSNYVKREQHPSDKRRAILKITHDGEMIVDEVRQVVSKYRSKALKGIDDEEITKINTTLDTIINNCH